MARTAGLLGISANWEPRVAEPFDGRIRVGLKSDLTQLSTWQNPDGNVYLYKEIIVSVYNDIPLNNGAYRLIDIDYTDINNWVKLGEGGGSFSISDWSVGVLYTIGTYIKYNGVIAECIFEHTSSVFGDEVDNWKLIRGNIMLTTAQRIAMSSAYDGLEIYDLDLGKKLLYNGGWIEL